MKGLPDEPSALIRVALEDLAKCESEGVSVNMYEWYKRQEDVTMCTVCLAGAVMRQRCCPTSVYAKDTYLNPEKMFSDDRRKLYALNAFREGNIHEGLEEMRLDDHKHNDDIPHDIFVTAYEDNRVQFYADMENMAKLLESQNL